MPQTPRADGWQRYSHHRRATIDMWDAGLTVVATGQPGADSQCNPHFFVRDEDVQVLELACFLQGTLIRDSGNRESRFAHFPEMIVGACSGVYTSYAFVECTSGFYHGRPISPESLRILGIRVND